VVTRVCVSVCLSVRGRTPTLLHGPGCNMGSGRGCPLVVHYSADLQSGHGLRCYGNITRTRNVSEYMLVLALCLVVHILSFYCWFYLHFICRKLNTTLRVSCLQIRIYRYQRKLAKRRVIVLLIYSFKFRSGFCNGRPPQQFFFSFRKCMRELNWLTMCDLTDIRKRKFLANYILPENILCQVVANVCSLW